MTDVGSRINLSTRSATPIYWQLAGQLKYLIVMGEIPAGARLPSARDLGANLDINRNTVNKAYSILADAGLVDANRGRGTIVRPSLPAGDPASTDTVGALIDQLQTEATRVGITQPEDLAALVLSHVRSSRSTRAVRVAFVECNPESLSHYERQIRSEFDMEIRPLLLHEIADVAADDPTIGDSMCVITTFFHYAEVRRALRTAGIDIEVVAIGVSPHVTVLRELAALPEGSVVGVAYVEDDTGFATERLRRMTEGVQHVNVRGLDIRPMLVDRDAPAAVFEGLDALLIRPENFRLAQCAAALPVPIIRFVNDLDSASRTFLDDIFRELADRHARAAPEGRDARASSTGTAPSSLADHPDTD